MTFGHLLTKRGPPISRPRLIVQLELLADGFSTTSVEIESAARRRGISEADFVQLAKETKKICPVSKALAGAPISLRVVTSAWNIRLSFAAVSG